MKKLLLFVTMAASLLFTQCKKEESVSSAGKTVSMTVTAGPGSKTDITENGAITWSDGDQLYVGDGSKYIGCLTLVGDGGSATGTFTGNVTLGEDVTGEKSFGFFYLGNAKDYSEDLSKGTSTSVEVDFSSQNIYAEDGKLQNASACHVGYGSAKGTVINDVVTDINVMLVSKVALARFSFTKDSQPYTGGLTLKGNNIYNEMTVNFDGTFMGKDGSTTNGISLGNGHGERYVILVPTSTVADQSLTFTGDNVEGPATLDDGIKPNQFYGKDTPIAVTLTPTTIPVTGVTLSKTSLSLEVGGTETLIATVYPDDATNPSVTWSSSATGVATVSDAGVVTAVAAGEATITVTATNGTDATDDDKTATCTVTVTAPLPPYLPGEFSVSANTKVKFSKGNLYYDGSVFHFEANQWGTQPASDGQWVSNHVSHFKWSDKDNAVTSDDNFSGTLFCASNFTVDGEAGGRTLSKDEWTYLMFDRSVTNRFAKAKVNGVQGLLIFPDNYSETTSGTGIAPVNNGGAAFPTSDIPSTTWTSMESAGVVFLPAAGSRYNGTSVYFVGSYGTYWSSTPLTDNAKELSFNSSYVESENDFYRGYGCSVRLVR